MEHFREIEREFGFKIVKIIINYKLFANMYIRYTSGSRDFLFSLGFKLEMVLALDQPQGFYVRK